MHNLMVEIEILTFIKFGVVQHESTDQAVVSGRLQSHLAEHLPEANCTTSDKDKNYLFVSYNTLFIYIQSWSELLAPLVNMIKEGCEN